MAESGSGSGIIYVTFAIRLYMFIMFFFKLQVSDIGSDKRVQDA